MALTVYFGTAPPAGHNGGVTQFNTVMGNSPDFYFMDYMKGHLGWVGSNAPTDPSLPSLYPVSNCDANGYPTSFPAGVTAYYATLTGIPYLTEYGDASGYTLLWDGPSGGAGVLNFPSTTLASTANSLQFIRTSDPATRTITASINVPGTTNIRLYRTVDITDGRVAAGQVFSEVFRQRVATQLKPRTIRSLGMGGYSGTNLSNAALWAHRCPRTYTSWSMWWFNPALWGGATTSSGFDYTVTGPPGFALTDKAAAHIVLNAVPPGTISGAYFGGTVTITSGSVAWTGHPMSANNAFMLQNTASFAATAASGSPVLTGVSSTAGMVIGKEINGKGIPAGARILTIGSGTITLDVNANMSTTHSGFGLGPMTPLRAGVFYYAKVISSANAFTFSETRGGTALATSASPDVMQIMPCVHLNIGGTGFKPVSQGYWPHPGGVFFGYPWVGDRGGATRTATPIYDATTGYYYMSALNTVGFEAGMPPEVFIEMCEAVGAHPHLVAPFMSTEVASDSNAVTDYMTSWMQHVRDEGPSWMKPIIEAPNETWNTGAAFQSTRYAAGVAMARWGYAENHVHEAYGKWVATLGKAASVVWGNDRSKYSMICAFQTVAFSSGLASNPTQEPRLKSNAYVLAYPAGAGAGYLWVDRVCGANYWSGEVRFTTDYLKNGWDCAVTYAGNTAQQDILAAINATSGNNTSDDTKPYTLPYVNKCFTGIKLFGQSMPVGHTIAGIVAYEGGYSPDFLSGDYPGWGGHANIGWMTSITAATKDASGCVLTLADTQNVEYYAPLPGGNPARVGMGVVPQSVGGMTQLNIATSEFGVTFTGGGSANITGTSALSVGDQIVFVETNYLSTEGRNRLPDELPPGKAFYVKTNSGTVLTVAATAGGAAITIATADTKILGSGYAKAAQCYRVKGVGVADGLAANQIRLDVNSSAFGTYTSGGGVGYCASTFTTNYYVMLSKRTQALADTNQQMYDNFAALAGPGFVAESPSQFLLFDPGSVWALINSAYAADTPAWLQMVDMNNP